MADNDLEELRGYIQDTVSDALHSVHQYYNTNEKLKHIIQDCPYTVVVHDLKRQSEKIEEFMEKADPLLDYISLEIETRRRRAEIANKILENVLGTGVLAILSAVGYWLWTNIVEDFL